MGNFKLSAVLLSIGYCGIIFANIALADTIDFCDKCTQDCTRGYVSNDSGAVVTKIRVTQNDAFGCSRVEHTRTKNMSSGNGQGYLLINGCSYNIKLFTTAGCIGKKKKGVITNTNNTAAERKTLISFDGACGSSINTKTKTYKHGDWNVVGDKGRAESCQN